MNNAVISICPNKLINVGTGNVISIVRIEENGDFIIRFTFLSKTQTSVRYVNEENRDKDFKIHAMKFPIKPE